MLACWLICDFIAIQPKKINITNSLMRERPLPLCICVCAHACEWNGNNFIATEKQHKGIQRAQCLPFLRKSMIITYQRKINKTTLNFQHPCRDRGKTIRDTHGTVEGAHHCNLEIEGLRQVTEKKKKKKKMQHNWITLDYR